MIFYTVMKPMCYIASSRLKIKEEAKKSQNEIMMVFYMGLVCFQSGVSFFWKLYEKICSIIPFSQVFVVIVIRAINFAHFPHLPILVFFGTRFTSRVESRFHFDDHISGIFVQENNNQWNILFWYIPRTICVSRKLSRFLDTPWTPKE